MRGCRFAGIDPPTGNIMHDGGGGIFRLHAIPLFC
jgi:hypothetical protein